MPVLVGTQPWARHSQLTQSSACRTSSTEGCLWTSCTLPVRYHPTQATGPQFPACTCVEVEPTLVSRAGSQNPPRGLQEKGRSMWKRCKGSMGWGSVHSPLCPRMGRDVGQLH